MLRNAFSWGLLVGALLAITDTTAVVLSDFQGGLPYLAWYMLASLPLAGAVLTTSLALWWRGATRLTERFEGPFAGTLKSFILGLPAGLFMIWVPNSWITEHFSGLGMAGKAASIAVYPLLIVISTLLCWVVRQCLAKYQQARPELPRAHYPLLLSTVILAVLSYTLDRSLLVGLYEDFHYGLAGLSSAAAAAGTMLVGRTLRAKGGALPALRALRWLAPGFGTAAAASLVLLELLSPDVFGPSPSLFFDKLAASARHWTDVDGDGYSSVFGGSDCAAFDGDRYPGNFDTPGDTVDADCSGSAAQWPSPAPESNGNAPALVGYNVLLITVDALRADHLGAWGYKKHPTSPNIDALAAQSLRFSAAFSPAPKTYDALPSLITGLYPSNVPRNYEMKVPGKIKKKPYFYRITDDVELLSETLQGQGYATGAAHEVWFLPVFGLDRGFDEYKSTHQVTHFAKSFLKRNILAETTPKPFFLWLHYYSPHDPYKKRKGFNFGKKTKDRYDSEIAYDDAQIGILLDKLDETGLAEKTIIVLTADHGEEFGEHGGKHHTLKLYRELTHVPLLIKIPGVAPAVIDTPVELPDVAPTLCALLGLSQVCPPHDGRNLVTKTKPNAPLRGAYTEIYRRRDRLWLNSLYTSEWHMIYDYRKDRAELYNTNADPKEQNDVSALHPELVQGFRDKLAMRPLYRQGLAFQALDKSGDTLEFVKKLPIFRRRKMLKLALERIETDLKPSQAKYIKRLLKRPDLDKKNKARVKRLLAKLAN